MKKRGLTPNSARCGVLNLNGIRLRKKLGRDGSCAASKEEDGWRSRASGKREQAPALQRKERETGMKECVFIMAIVAEQKRVVADARHFRRTRHGKV